MIEVGLPGGRAVFSTRAGGVSSGPYESLNLGRLTHDDPKAVEENHRRLAARAVPYASAVQVHGTELHEWAALPEGAPPEGDGHLTRAPGIGLMVLVADCLPIALVAPGRAAMLHCGWRGLAGGIVEAALDQFDEPPHAVIGPGIGRCCYEVGAEVIAEFAELGSVAEGRMLDLKAVAHAKLGRAACVEDVGLCTSCNPALFFSHRRDDGVTGRQAGVAWLTR